jgi:hypothetical protein
MYITVLLSKILFPHLGLQMFDNRNLIPHSGRPFSGGENGITERRDLAKLQLIISITKFTH